VLRLRLGYGFFSFGTFSVLWTSIAFLLARHYHDSTGVIGLFGLAGAAGAVTASVAGRISDRGWAPYSSAIAAALPVVSWAALWAGGHSLALLLLGIVVLDVGANGLHITNEAETYRLRPEARSRLTAAYMAVYFAGGAAGPVLSATLYGALGWDGVCLAGAGFAAGSLGLWLAMWIRRWSPTVKEHS
jgi:predicted MFS family arabinose efflux permease